MEPKAIVFFDLDGTLLNQQAQIEPEIIVAIEKLKEQNILPVIATGRTQFDVEESLQHSGINTLITLNGQYVEHEGQEIYSDTISKKVIHRLLSFSEQRGNPLAYYSYNEITISKITPLVEKAYKLLHSPLPTLQTIPKETANMLLIISEDGDELFREKFPELQFIRNWPFAIDVINRGSSKAKGIQKFLCKLNLEDIPTYAFGDGPNDHEMFNCVTYKIAMGNAIDSLKQQADYVTGSNIEGGIVQGLKYFNLL
ncbi:Cof subfamily protein (haloacid dehalogenase superfamily) [Enterococcus sp. PF1-24]|uniref:Cof-type HAD-IIB family hydrolase n=1 Tax=unclassified Enterococcus TaxID=2608891 RepID=UPI0024755583|nr:MULTISPECIES: Cof-type HAD-IIB family hydrolase [unclassified Enterococcus]MDH6364238.1 Cof subfamily protein (haloacid dehalogenase superfamily) [Enterococcus sp. PFB1-1]MDH6401403.1 Cof subfamily protein (haloacid dehalogenase superfamily) [Enterococcus sp. PF1-24]